MAGAAPQQITEAAFVRSLKGERLYPAMQATQEQCKADVRLSATRVVHLSWTLDVPC